MPSHSSAESTSPGRSGATVEQVVKERFFRVLAQYDHIHFSYGQTEHLLARNLRQGIIELSWRGTSSSSALRRSDLLLSQTISELMA